MNGLQVALVALMGGFLTLERKSFFQLMLSRPIVAAPLIGSLLGNASVGLQLGVPLELYYLGASSYGVSSPHHETLAAIFAAALAASSGLPETDAHPPPLVVVFILSLLVGWLGRSIEAALERWNGGLVDRAESSVSQGRLGRATSQLLLGLPGPFLLGATVAAFATLLGPVLSQWPEDLPPKLTRGFTAAWWMVLGVSAALAVRAIKTPKVLRYSGAGALVTAVVIGLLFALQALH